MNRKKAVFLDRDGTINEENGYLYRIEECRFLPGAGEALAHLKEAGFLIVVVTNQSGIARGYYSAADVEKLHQYMAKELAEAKIDGWYYCPHHPEFPAGDEDCNCRKPLPGMLLTAAAELGIDLVSSWMVGDKKADIEAGIAAGCRPILILTGYGAGDAACIPKAVPVVADLPAAAEYILRNCI